MVQSIQAVPALEAQFVLAEGPCWNSEREELSWVDLDTGTLWLAGVSSTGQVVDACPIVATGSRLSFAIPDNGGGWYAGHGDTVVHIARNGLLRDVVAVRRRGPHMLNDAAADAQGRLWFGSVARDYSPGGGALFCLAGGEPRLVLDGMDLPNGLGWSPDGERMFVTDSHARRITAHRYLDGEAGSPAVYVEYSDGAGIPDGLCVDTDGGVWSAIFRGGRVERRDPFGNLSVVVEVPVSQVSSAALAGPDRDLLVITTGRRTMTADQLAAEPAAGCLFVARVDFQGLPHRYAAPES